MRGAARDRHERAVGCGGRDGGERRTPLSRTAKSCGPDAPMLASSSREPSLSRATVATKPGHRGEHEVSRNPSRRESRIASAGPVCSCAHFFVHIAHETAGAARIRLSLRSLLRRRAEGYASRPQPNGIEAPFPQPRRSLFCEFLYVRDFRHTMHPRIDLRCWFSLNLGPVANGGFSLRCP